MDKPLKELAWYYERMNDEGRRTLLKIARAFVATGSFARDPELSEEAKAFYARISKNVNQRMDEDF